MSVHDLPTRRPPRPPTDTRETVPAPRLERETVPVPPIDDVEQVAHVARVLPIAPASAPPSTQEIRRRSGVIAKIPAVEEVVMLRQSDGRRER